MSLVGVGGEPRDVAPLRNRELRPSLSTEFKTLLKPLEHPGSVQLGKEVFESRKP